MEKIQKTPPIEKFFKRFTFRADIVDNDQKCLDTLRKLFSNEIEIYTRQNGIQISSLKELMVIIEEFNINYEQVRIISTALIQAQNQDYKIVSDYCNFIINTQSYDEMDINNIEKLALFTYQNINFNEDHFIFKNYITNSPSLDYSITLLCFARMYNILPILINDYEFLMIVQHVISHYLSTCSINSIKANSLFTIEYISFLVLNIDPQNWIIPIFQYEPLLEKFFEIDFKKWIFKIMVIFQELKCPFDFLLSEDCAELIINSVANESDIEDDIFEEESLLEEENQSEEESQLEEENQSEEEGQLEE